jgi:hypothetical protein
MKSTTPFFLIRKPANRLAPPMKHRDGILCEGGLNQIHDEPRGSYEGRPQYHTTKVLQGRWDATSSHRSDVIHPF